MWDEDFFAEQYARMAANSAKVLILEIDWRMA
jgi:hypothetical protein